MKYRQIIILAMFLIGCDPSSEETPYESTAATLDQNEEQTEEQTDSFSIRNAEIREDVLTKLVERDIQHWINDDGSIGYDISNADEIDNIIYRAVGEYAARN